MGLSGSPGTASRGGRLPESKLITTRKNFLCTTPAKHFCVQLVSKPRKPRKPNNSNKPNKSSKQTKSSKPNKPDKLNKRSTDGPTNQQPTDHPIERPTDRPTDQPTNQSCTHEVFSIGNNYFSSRVPVVVDQRNYCQIVYDARQLTRFAGLDQSHRHSRYLTSKDHTFASQGSSPSDSPFLLQQALRRTRLGRRPL